MKAILLSTFLTLVCFSLNGWSKGGDRGYCSVDASGTIADHCNDGFTASPGAAITGKPLPGSSGSGPTPGETTGFLCTCVPDTDATSKKDCAGYASTYGTDYDTSATKADKLKQDALENSTKTQSDITKAQQKATDAVTRIKKEIQDTTAQYQKDLLDQQRNAQKDQMSVQDTIRKQQLQLSDMQSKQLPMAQQAVVSAQFAYAAVVNVHSVTMIRAQCFKDLEGYMSAKKGQSTIKGGLGNSGGQSSYLDGIWNSCMTAGQNNASAAISQAQQAIQSAQGDVANLQSTITAAQQALASANASMNQEQKQSMQANQIAATAYQQKMTNLQSEMQTTLQQSQQQAMQLTMQSGQTAQLNSTLGKTNKKMDSDLNTFQQNCCDGDSLNATMGGSSDSAMAQYCSQDLSIQNPGGNDSAMQAFGAVAPGLLQMAMPQPGAR